SSRSCFARRRSSRRAVTPSAIRRSTRCRARRSSRSRSSTCCCAPAPIPPRRMRHGRRPSPSSSRPAKRSSRSCSSSRSSRTARTPASSNVTRARCAAGGRLKQPARGADRDQCLASRIRLNGVADPVEKMAQRSGLTERTFKRRFLRATGYTPLNYVQQLRIEEAKRRLERTDEPVEKIGWLVGYEDPAFFRRLFKRVTGVTPGQYRRQFQPPGHPTTAARPKTEPGTLSEKA